MAFTSPLTFPEDNTPLGIAGVRTGVTRDNSLYGASRFRVFASTDQASAANGMVIQQSDDGITWYTTDSFSLLANAPKVLEGNITKRFCRGQLTNGGVIQTTLNLTTSFVQ